MPRPTYRLVGDHARNAVIDTLEADEQTRPFPGPVALTKGREEDLLLSARGHLLAAEASTGKERMAHVRRAVADAAISLWGLELVMESREEEEGTTL
jgi:hypothetical protein